MPTNPLEIQKSQEDLLRAPEELENDAYAAQEEKIAYANVEHAQ